MKGSFKIAKLFGIDIFLHWTFFLLFVWLGWSYANSGVTPSEAAIAFTTIVALFGCVVLHELGHALTARRFGIGTSDITLLPIGGVARLERMPRDPMQEFWVAVAGPAVNVVIAAVLLVVMIAVGQTSFDSNNVLTGRSILANLFAINVVLVIFNMLPAFPMDGGRVLRAVLAMRMDYATATKYAAGVGRLMAVLFAIIGLTGNPMLLFIALFVYLGAGAEARMAEMTALIGQLRVRSGMMTRFRTLAPSDTLATASRELIEGYQDDFPVCEGDTYLGMLRRSTLAGAIEQHGEGHPVGDFVQTDSLTATQDESLEELSMQMQQQGISTVAVLDGQRIVGVVSQENVNELLMIRSAQAKRQGQTQDGSASTIRAGV